MGGGIAPFYIEASDDVYILVFFFFWIFIFSIVFLSPFFFQSPIHSNTITNNH